MSKAEQRAKEVYPKPKPRKIITHFGTFEFDEYASYREGYVKGYEQAEKDLALTPEDIIVILNLAKEHSPEETAELFNRTRE